VGIIAYVAWWYRTREEPVRGRAVAAVLRGAALFIAWLILLNPSLPGGWGVSPGGGAVLLDASYSMLRPVRPGGETIWKAARDSLVHGEPVWLFGGTVPEYAVADSLPDEPLYNESRLAPAVRAAALGGVRRIRVLSDGRLVDAAAALAEAGRQGVELTLVAIATGYPEAGIAEVAAPGWAQVGDSIAVEVRLAAMGAAADTLRVQIVDAASVVRAAGSVPSPSAGRYASVRLQLRLTGPAGFQRFTARLESERPDPETRDELRVFYVRVSERPVGPVLLSLKPDWEPSFIVASLDRATQAPTFSYLWLADSLVSAADYERVPIATVRRRARRAPLLALHGYSGDAPDWVHELVSSASRLLILPSGDSPIEVPGWEIRIGAPAGGEWYAAAELPASPVVLQLGDFPEEELAPLLRVREIEAPAAWHPLRLRRMRRGEPVPALAAGRSGERRWAVAAAEGYWRWAFRRGPGRQLYRGLWTGVAGWLVQGAATGEAGLHPRRRVVQRGEPLRWVSPGGVDSLTVELVAAEAGSVAVWRGVAGAADSAGVIVTPGAYRYNVQAYRGGRSVASAAGPAEVEAFSRELLPQAPAPLADTATVAGAELDGTGPDRRRRLATLGWPYLLVILLFCAEWAVRRYSGLR
jgi:hypothetical protein